MVVRAHGPGEAGGRVAQDSAENWQRRPLGLVHLSPYSGRDLRVGSASCEAEMDSRCFGAYAVPRMAERRSGGRRANGPGAIPDVPGKARILTRRPLDADSFKIP